MDHLQHVPSWLETPVKGRVSLPVNTRHQELPFSELTWENFERLCLRLARLEADVELCQLYGVRGENQQGIDLFARVLGASKYRVYQCKREKDFGPAKIKAATSKFLAGSWKNRTEVFCLCTKESLQSAKRAEEIESQRHILSQEGIKLLLWDSTQLSILLKDHPRLVDDFYGREWVELFCGEDIARGLGNRLDTKEVEELRSRLGQFYKRVFNTHDPGIPHGASHSDKSLSLEDRFIVPDVIDRRAVKSPTDSTSPDQSSEFDQAQHFDHKTRGNENPAKEVRKVQWTFQERQSVERWLPATLQTVLLGDPGSGKSSLLRFIAIDLLSDSPRLEVLSYRWGRHLPVWVPFAFWTKLEASDSSAANSLTRVLQLWLKNFDEENLWPLVESALADDRLLLLVDGLDEWESEDAANIALDKLQIFAGQHQVPVIATSRPRGFERLRSTVHTWRVGRLAGLSTEQQRMLSISWFRHLFQDQTPKTESDAEAEAFIGELSRTADLAELAKIPLLLCLLIYHRFQNLALPSGRFRAYESIVDHLIITHPRRRRAVALVHGDDANLTEDDTRAAFASVAYHIQCFGRGGTVTDTEAVNALQAFLCNEIDGFGMTRSEARMISQKLLEIAEGEVGLLVRRSSDEVGFMHRTFQEYLVGHHLSRLSLDKQRSSIELNTDDPQWHEVVLSLFHLTRRTEDVDKLLSCVDNPPANHSLIAQHGREVLKAEIAFGNFRSPTRLSRTIAQNVFLEIERGHWMPHRENLLGIALGGLRSSTVGSLVKDKVSQWFPCRPSWKVSIYEAMSDWPVCPEVIECLWNGMHSDDLHNQRAAAQALIKLGGGNSELGDRCATLALEAVLPSVRAVALEAVVQGWPKHPKVPDLISAYHDSLNPDLRLLAILCRVRRSEHTKEDLDVLLTLACRDTGVDYSFQSTLIDTILEGWPHDNEVKVSCIRGVSKEFLYKPGEVDRDLAFEVLLRGFPQDDQVAKECLAEIINNPYPFNFGLRKYWDLLALNPPTNPELLSALDDWIVKQEFNGPEIYHASLITRSPKVKSKLLSVLEESHRFWAAKALLDGWGMQDKEVESYLSRLATGNNSKSAAVGHLLPRIIDDQTKCRKRLLQLLHDTTIIRPAFVLDGLQQIGVNNIEEVDVVEIVFDKVLTREDLWAGELGYVKTHLIEMFPTDNRVREFAVKELSSRLSDLACPSVGIIARAYSQDEQIRKQVMNITCCLPNQLRRTIVQHLDAMPVMDEYSHELLSQYDIEQDEGIKVQASIAYHRRLRTRNTNLESALGYLTESIGCIGPDYEARRRAAFCALIELDRLDVMQNTEEDPSKINEITLHRYLGSSNIPTIKQILSHWQIFWDAEKGCPRKGIFRDEESADYWNEFYLLADQYESPRETALRRLEMPSQRTATIDELQFLARVRPGSQLLLEHCAKFLQLRDSRTDMSGSSAVAAAEILGVNFADHEYALSLVLSNHNPQRLYNKLVLALCEGWPSHEILHSALKMIHDGQTWFSDETIVRVICRVGSEVEVYDLISNCLMIRRRLPDDWEQTIGKPIIRRLSTDDNLLDRLMGQLHAAPNPSQKSSIPRLISCARGGMSEIREWSVKELDHQLNGTPELGMDIVTGTIRPVAHALLDVLSLPTA